jgi:hypothetical protein
VHEWRCQLLLPGTRCHLHCCRRASVAVDTALQCPCRCMSVPQHDAANLCVGEPYPGLTLRIYHFAIQGVRRTQLLTVKYVPSDVRVLAGRAAVTVGCCRLPLSWPAAPPSTAARVWCTAGQHWLARATRRRCCGTWPRPCSGGKQIGSYVYIGAAFFLPHYILPAAATSPASRTYCVDNLAHLLLLLVVVPPGPLTPATTSWSATGCAATHARSPSSSHCAAT